MKQFDEDTRIEKTRIVKKKTEAFVCKQCLEKYSSNIKLHEHMRNKHNKKSKKVINNKDFSHTFNSVISFTSLVLSLLTSSTSTLLFHMSIELATLFTLSITLYTTTSTTPKTPIL